MTNKIKNPRLPVLKKYIEAVKLIEAGELTIRQALAKVGISQTTYYAYLAQFGDNIEGNKIFLPVRKEAEKTVPAQVTQKVSANTGTDLDRILLENAALAEQLKLRAELAKMMH